MIRGKQWLCFILGVCSMTEQLTAQNSRNLKLIHQWNQLEFDYKSAMDRQKDIDLGLFAAGAIAPIDVDVFYTTSPGNNQIFVTIPRFREGVPASLGTISNKELNGNPVIQPYPDWQWHRHPQRCLKNRIISVFRIKIDECNRLWIVDTGKIGDKYLCPPQILAFDLNTNRLMHQYEFPVEVVSLQHLLVTPAVDVRDPKSGCQDTFVYVADVLGFSLLVYDVANKKSWRIQDKTFYPFPTHGTYNIAGDSFDLMDGILGLTLSPFVSGKDRILYYHAMSSPTENWVYTSNLRNETIFSEDPAAAPQIFNTYRDERSSQSAAEAMNRDGVLFFGLLSEIQIVCWNSWSEYKKKNFDVIASDSVSLQFPSGIKVISNKKNEEELWILTSRFQRVASGTLTSREINFRIQAGKVEDLIPGTKCKPKLANYNNQMPGQGGGYGLYGNSQ
ncbi:hypothetical protein ABEB36_009767 [Hypothenemus hampei]|uniref:Bee-milk protein n=1 Tax=Hypothenemus hampei TaxID=57062 RepID=A0ABD1EHE2_HYPHA